MKRNYEWKTSWRELVRHPAKPRRKIDAGSPGLITTHGGAPLALIVPVSEKVFELTGEERFIREVSYALKANGHQAPVRAVRTLYKSMIDDCPSAVLVKCFAINAIWQAPKGKNMLPFERQPGYVLRSFRKRRNK